MIKKKNLVLLIVFIFLSNCSLDDKSGIWDGTKKEKKRILELEEKQKNIKNINKIYSSEDIYNKEINLTRKLNISEAKKNLSWEESNLNKENNLGNIYFNGLNYLFLKKKIGKNKFSISKVISSPLIIENNIILSDNTGTIFNIDQNGKINWKKNIYKKIYKKVFKNLVFSVYNKKVYIADNIGFVYSLDLISGKVDWIKNHGVPLKSNIKVFQDKIFLINQDNRIFCLNANNGSKIWDIRSVSSFIKEQNFLSSAITNQKEVIFITSSGDLMMVSTDNGRIFWTVNTLESTLSHASDFFTSSEIVVSNDIIIFSAKSSIFSFNIATGYMNWKNNVSSVGAPIVDGENIFINTKNGYFVILNKENGEIISSTNILNILKKGKRNTSITGFIMGSGKIYSTTSNGFLIVSSSISGKVENFKKIGDPITSSPVISDGKLYILTQDSRLFVFN